MTRVKGLTVAGPTYIAVTHCKNEEKTITNCVESVLNQTVPPAVYVVVDDGSTDGTPEILNGFESRIEIVSLEATRTRERGDHHRNLLLLSYHEAVEKVADWQYLLTVDADEILYSDYLERILSKMEEDPKLGMASGIPISKVVGGYRKIYKASHGVWNGARVYRRGCWDDLGAIPSIQGWDKWVQFEANRLGWRTEPFDDINFVEERPWGGTTLKYWIRRGFSRKLLGYSTLTHIITCSTRLTHRPYFFGSLAFFLSFMLYGIRGERYFSEDYHDFVRRHTLKYARGWLKISRIRSKLKV